MDPLFYLYSHKLRFAHLVFSLLDSNLSVLIDVLLLMNFIFLSLINVLKEEIIMKPVEINGEWTLSFHDEQQKLDNEVDGLLLHLF